jgi:indole-3-glycerol phosphate synthase
MKAKLMRVAHLLHFFTALLLFKLACGLIRQQSGMMQHISLPLSSSYNNLEGATWLDRAVARKRIEVDNLLRRHQDLDDPLVMRMGYMASESRYTVTNALKRNTTDKEQLHTMSVMVDLKRRSPTIPHRRNVVEFQSASQFAELLALADSDALLINTDEQEYGGKLSDLRETTRTLRKLPGGGPACICKDIIIHPVQIAQALENGADGVLLIVGIVGGDLEVLLDACTIMGTEAIVEVHTPNELEFALSKGATIFLANMWDRTTSRMFKDQAKGLASMMPMNSVAIAAGDIRTLEEVAELGLFGFDCVVLGRALADIDDIKDFIDGVHDFRGAPRNMGMGGGFGMKGNPFL